MRPVEALIPYARNAKQHSDAQVAQIAASIREFGWGAPILVDGRNNVIAGHGRLLAARKLGMAEVPVVPMEHLTDTQRKALIMADNRIAENAAWDDELLRLELTDLLDAGFDPKIAGFDDVEVQALIDGNGTVGLTDPDDAPEPAAEGVAEPGDVWILGRHRLVCGDCTDPLVVEKALNGVKPHLMVTDPPYGVEYDPTRRSSNAKKSGKVLNDDRADWREAWALFPGDVAYIWHASMHTHTVLASLEACGFEHRAMIVWAKDRFTLSRGNYHWQHDPAWYAVRKRANG